MGASAQAAADAAVDQGGLASAGLAARPGPPTAVFLATVPAPACVPPTQESDGRGFEECNGGSTSRTRAKTSGSRRSPPMPRKCQTPPNRVPAATGTVNTVWQFHGPGTKTKDWRRPAARGERHWPNARGRRQPSKAGWSALTSPGKRRSRPQESGPGQYGESVAFSMAPIG